jgi:hypothetical protein
MDGVTSFVGLSLDAAGARVWGSSRMRIEGVQSAVRLTGDAMQVQLGGTMRTLDPADATVPETGVDYNRHPVQMYSCAGSVLRLLDDTIIEGVGSPTIDGTVRPMAAVLVNDGKLVAGRLTLNKVPGATGTTAFAGGTVGTIIAGEINGTVDNLAAWGSANTKINLAPDNIALKTSATATNASSPNLRNIASSDNTAAVADRMIRVQGTNEAVYKTASGATGVWFDADGVTRYTPGRNLGGTAAGTWTASSVAGWYYLTPALTDVAQVLEGDRIGLMTAAISSAAVAGRYAIGNADGLGGNTLYVKPFGGDPALIAASTIRYRTAADGVITASGRRRTFGTAIPTTGYALRGDEVLNIAPASGGIPGWRCTASGLPGTWEPMATLSGATTISNLQSASTAGIGARAFVTDAAGTTFASVAVGGGTNAVPVYSDGTNWRIG